MKRSIFPKVVARTAQYLNNKGVTKKLTAFNEQTIHFIETAAPQEWANEAKKTIEFHRKCMNSGFSDGRKYYQYMLNDEIVGLCGYQHRECDPDDVVWGGFYIMSPQASHLLKLSIVSDVALELANHTSYRKIYIEVFADTEKSNMFGLCVSLGLEFVGVLPNFYGPSQDMQIALFDVEHLRRSLRQREATPQMTLMKQASQMTS